MTQTCLFLIKVLTATCWPGFILLAIPKPQSNGIHYFTRCSFSVCKVYSYSEKITWHAIIVTKTVSITRVTSLICRGEIWLVPRKFLYHQKICMEIPQTLFLGSGAARPFKPSNFRHACNNITAYLTLLQFKFLLLTSSFTQQLKVRYLYSYN